MAQQILMPQLGESVAEGKIVEWFVKAGDTVETTTVLVEVETDKANTEIPANIEGTVTKILVQAGETVEVGTPIAEIGEAGEAAAEPEDNTEPASAAAAPEPEPEPERPAATPAAAPAPPPAPKPAERPQAPSSNEKPWNANNIVATPTRSATPLPLSQRSPTGAALAAMAGEAQQAPAGPYGAPPGGKYYKPPVVKAEPEDTVIPFSKRRGIISEHMVYSKHVSPHVPCFAEVDVTAVMNVRAKHKKRMEAQGVRLSLLAFVLKATCEALREYPDVNSVVGTDEIIQRGRVHLGVAVETDGGLLVPVIRDADSLSVSGLARAVDDLADRARNKKITVDDLQGGTFSVSNPGRKGNLFGAAIINQPQVGILRMGEMRRMPVVRVVDGEEVICIRSMMFLALSYDHRIIDGVNGNGFLYEIRERLENASFDI
jgi:2-oxoglutarate dehydrogenase E2 component (dihydrolipoamide succinyltransferase)